MHRSLGVLQCSLTSLYGQFGKYVLTMKWNQSVDILKNWCPGCLNSDNTRAQNQILLRQKTDWSLEMACFYILVLNEAGVMWLWYLPQQNPLFISVLISLSFCGFFYSMFMTFWINNLIRLIDLLKLINCLHVPLRGTHPMNRMFSHTWHWD